MANFPGGVLEMGFPDLSPANVPAIPYTPTLRNNITPVPEDVYNWSANYGEMPAFIPRALGWILTTPISVNSNAWPTMQRNGDQNSHTAPIGQAMSGYDWFEKIIASPASIVLGAFVTKSEDITVYSSFRFVIQQLDNINLTTGAGTSIPNPPSLPFQHPRQKSITVTFLADPTGPATVNGDVIFDYAAVADAVVAVTGQRIFIFPWVPEDNMKERMEWSTDIIKATNQEQRRALRESPRITRSFRFYLSETQRMEFEKDAGNRGVLYTAPSWWDARYITGVSVNDTTVNVDTSFSEFADGGLCLFVEPESNVFEVKTIQTVNPTDLVLNDPIENNFATGFAVPVLPGILINSNIKIHNQNHYFATVEIVVTEAFERTPPAYPQLLGIDRLDERSIIRKTIPVNVSKAGTVVDNKIGPIGFFAKENRPRTQEKFEWRLNTAQQRFELKDWLYSRFGRQKQFLYPSWQSDILIHTDDYAGGSGTLNVKTTELEAPFYFQVELNDGTVYQAQCTSITKDTGFDTLTHNPAIANGFTVAEVKYISKVRLMRHSSDSIDLTHSNYQKTAAAVNMVEI